MAEPGRFRANWKLSVKILVTASILAVVFRKNDWSVLGRELSAADPVWMILAFLCMGIGLVGTSFRWDYLLKVQDIHLPVRKVGIITMIGIFFNQFLLGSTGGDVIKIFYIVKQAPKRKTRATLSIVIDRVLGLLAMLFVIMLLLPWELRRLEKNHEAFLIVMGLGLILAALSAGALSVWLFPVRKLPAFCHRIWEKIPRRKTIAILYDGCHAHAKAIRPTLLALLWTAFTVTAILSTGYLIARAIHLDIGYPEMTMLFAIILCAISIPISVSGHGVREGMFIMLFSVFSVTRHGLPVGQETAFACSIIFFGLNLIWGLIGGVIYLGYSHALKVHAPALESTPR